MDAMQKVAEKVNRHLFKAQRGAVPFENGVLVFGNDGFEQDPVARDEVGLVEAWLVDEGYAVEGSARSADGYTWVISAVLPTELEAPGDDEVVAGEVSERHRAAVAAADRAVWGCYAKAKERATGEPCSFAPSQRDLARAEIDKVLGAGVLFD